MAERQAYAGAHTARPGHLHESKSLHLPTARLQLRMFLPPEGSGVLHAPISLFPPFHPASQHQVRIVLSWD